ncbi:flagellar brake protein [Oceanicoccus sagamiensis]|nr:flagellar brake protein [Oceanicoccus sagamiensis]
MITSFIDRLRGKPALKADNALNYTYLHLHQAQRNRDFLEVKIEGDEVLYQSIILESDPNERTLLIDELFPTGFVGLPGQKVHLAIRQKGGRKIKFESTILEQHRYDDAPIYVLAMPQDIEAGQRRSAYRLPIANSSSIDSHFVGPEGNAYHGLLRNVSSTGIAMDVLLDEMDNSGGPDNFQYNDILDELVFDFAGVNIQCEASVRSVEVDPNDQKHILIGAEFVDLPPVEQRVLERSIMRIQRDRIKLSGAFEADMALA